MNLRDLGLGFTPEPLVSFNLDPSLNGYSADRAKIFYQRLTDAVGPFRRSFRRIGFRAHSKTTNGIVP